MNETILHPQQPPANRTATVHHFRRPLPRCAACGGPHRPARPWHTICSRCFSWSMAAWHQSRMAMVLEGARR